jgi:hypothetical protein
MLAEGDVGEKKPAIQSEWPVAKAIGLVRRLDRLTRGFRKELAHFDGWQVAVFHGATWKRFAILT